MRWRRSLALTGAALLAAAVAGCGGVPRDQKDALARAEAGGVVRVGVAHNPPWVTVEHGRVGGVEPVLLERWAARTGAKVIYEPGAPEPLVERLHARELDVLALGLEKTTPLVKKAALTQPYLTTATHASRPGKATGRVLAVTQGESGLLYSLDRFLLDQDEVAMQQAASR